MQNDFWIDMALSIVFSAIRSTVALQKYERAFRKLYDALGRAYGWTTQDGPSNQLDLNVRP